MATLTAPACIAPEGESNKALSKVRAKLAARPSLRSSVWLYDAQRLATSMHALGRDDDALAVARWLAANVTFQGNYDLWTPVGFARCLAARILRRRGDADGALDAVRPLVAADIFAVLTPDDVRARVVGHSEILRRVIAEPDSARVRLRLHWAISGLLHYRETADLDLPHAPHVDRVACDAALEEGLAGLARFLGP